ncbi:MAG: tetratricopeptide repeat protein [Candidatus Riflebacteria bacterium]|nr:tetratricopeptide repeat protein [Candidatus Riflebacteria bacterium]
MTVVVAFVLIGIFMPFGYIKIQREEKAVEHWELAKRHGEKANFEQAIEELLKAHAILPKEIPVLEGLGEYYFFTNQFEQSKVYVDKALPEIKRQKNNKQESILLARLYEKKGALFVMEEKYSEALEPFKLAAEADPDNGARYTALAYTYILLKDYEAAAKYSEEAIKHNLADDIAQIYAATAKELAPLMLSNLEFRKAVEDSVRDKHTIISRLYGSLRYFALAAEEIVKIHNLYPEELNAIEQIISLYSLAAKGDKVESFAKKGIALAERQGNTEAAFSFYDILGTNYIAQEKYYQAMDAYKSALKINPENPEANLNMSLVYQLLEDHKSALQWAEKALQLPSLTEEEREFAQKFKEECLQNLAAKK